MSEDGSVIHRGGGSLSREDVSGIEGEESIDWLLGDVNDSNTIDLIEDSDGSQDENETIGSGRSLGFSRTSDDVTGLERYSSGGKDDDGTRVASPVDVLLRKVTSKQEELDFGKLDEEMNHLLKNTEIRETLMEDIDLKEHLKHVEETLLDYEQESLQDYVKHLSKFFSLYHELKDCDGILANLEQLLSGFQESLGQLSDEITSLQEQSIKFNIQLKNRKDMKLKTELFVDNLQIPQDLARNLLTADLNDHYLHFLMILQSKIQFIRETKRDFTLADPSSTILSLQEALPEIDRLQRKVVQRFEKFFTTKMKSMKSPEISIQQFQQEELLRYKFFYLFLKECDLVVANEIRDAYVHYAQLHYMNLLEMYEYRLKTREATPVGKEDLISSEHLISKIGFFDSILSSSGSREKGTMFNGISRWKRLRALLDSDRASELHSSKIEESHLPLEIIVYELCKVLVDYTTSESMFLQEFFDQSDITSISDTLMKPTILFIQDHLRQRIEISYDTNGLLLSLFSQKSHTMILSERRMEYLETFTTFLGSLLRQRASDVLDEQIQSIKTYAGTLHFRASPTLQDTQTHFVIRRYAQLLSFVLCIHPYLKEESIIDRLHSLTSSIEILLLKLAEQFRKRAKEYSQLRQIFLINNYDLILTALNETLPETSGKLEKDRFSSLLDMKITEWIDSTLRDSLGYLMDFIEDFRRSDKNQISDTHMLSISRKFHDTYKANLQEIHQTIMTSFSSFKTGNHILHGILRLVMEHYQRFLDLVENYKVDHDIASLNESLVDIQHVMLEMRRYKLTFS